MEDQQPYTEADESGQQRVAIERAAHETQGRFKKSIQAAFYTFLSFLKSFVKAMARQFRGR